MASHLQKPPPFFNWKIWEQLGTNRSDGCVFIDCSHTQKQISFQLEDSLQAALNALNACDLRLSNLQDEANKQQERISEWTLLKDGYVSIQFLQFYFSTVGLFIKTYTTGLLNASIWLVDKQSMGMH